MQSSVCFYSLGGNKICPPSCNVGGDNDLTAIHMVFMEFLLASIGIYFVGRTKLLHVNTKRISDFDALTEYQYRTSITSRLYGAL